MESSQIIESVKSKLDSATQRFNQELQKIRSGRVHPSMLDSVMVEVYGQTMPLKAVAGVVAPEAQLLQITPFDPNNLQAIAEAIRSDQALGLTPTDDGRVIRINLPPLTSEDRQRLAKVISQKVEETMIAARQVRHEARARLDEIEKDKDDRIRMEKQIDDLVASQKSQIDKLAAEKEREITSI